MMKRPDSTANEDALRRCKGCEMAALNRCQVRMRGRRAHLVCIDPFSNAIAPTESLGCNTAVLS